MAKPTAASPQQRAPLTNPKTGAPLAPKRQPGYYPGYETLQQQKFWDEATREVVLKRVNGPDEPYRFFSAQEVRTLEAVVDRILPQDDRTDDRRIPILPSIDARLAENRLAGYRYDDMPPDQEAYRLGARAFELMAQRLRGCSFDQMSTHDQELFLKSIHDAEPLEAREEWAKMNVERFWTLLTTDVAGTYYAHPWAWDEVGFGGPAYPRGYMRLREGQAEPYEVEEQRYEWVAPADTLSDVEERHGTGKEHQSGGEGGTH